MFDSAINQVVRLTIAHSTAQLERLTAGHPPAFRTGLKSEIERTGEAWRYESGKQSAYYMKRQGRGVMIWRWNHVASEHEAGRLRALVTSLQGPLDAHRANRVFEHATRRSIGNPRPAGPALHAVGALDRAAG